MGNLANIFKNDSKAIYVGEVISALGSNKYMVHLDGEDRKTYSTIQELLHTGEKVILNNISDKWFIIRKTGFVGKSSSIKEIIRNG